MLEKYSVKKKHLRNKVTCSTELKPNMKCTNRTIEPEWQKYKSAEVQNCRSAKAHKYKTGIGFAVYSHFNTHSVLQDFSLTPGCTLAVVGDLASFPNPLYEDFQVSWRI